MPGCLEDCHRLRNCLFESTLTRRVARPGATAWRVLGRMAEAGPGALGDWPPARGRPHPGGHAGRSGGRAS
jgi:hypothetical protein